MFTLNRNTLLSLCKLVLQQYLFLLLLYALTRLIFLVSNSGYFTNVSLKELILTFVYGWRIDTTMACYLLFIPILLVLAFGLSGKKIWLKANRFFLLFIVVVTILITIGDLAIFKEWQNKLNFRALTYLKNPEEVWRSAEPWIFFLGAFLLVTVFILMKYLLDKMMNFKTSPKKNYLAALLFFILSSGLTFLGLRGVGITPIDQSDVYFSKNDFVNMATTNTTHNLLRSIEQNKKYLATNPYNFFSKGKAEEIKNNLYRFKNDSIPRILNNVKPNIVYIILEGWTADLVGSLGGYPNKHITPGFDTLSEEGLLFTNTLATGTRSHEGMVGLFSGFPAQPSTHIANQYDKYSKLPNFVHSMNDMGYQTSFMFGGDLKHGKVLDYIFNCHFDHLLGEEDWDASTPKGKLGVHDEFLFEKQLEEIAGLRPPFLSVSFTLSTHSPYDYPMENAFDFGGEHKKYVNSMYYADKCLKNFIDKASREPWYRNTLFVIVADHSHGSPRNRTRKDVLYRRIPMLFFGEALKKEYRGKQIDRFCNQTDISKTLLNQLGVSTDNFNWSIDMLNPNKSFSYYTFHDGVGFIDSSGNAVYDHELQKTIFYNTSDKNAQDTLELKAKAMLQLIFQTYLDL